MTHKEHNDALAKLIAKNLKKDLPSIESQRQGYKGTGAKSHRRQIFIRSVGEGVSVDIWLCTGCVDVGGVHVNAGRSTFLTEDKSPEKSYQTLLVHLRALGF